MSSGSENKEKIRVAFLILGSSKWLGGLHYLKNLLHALSVQENSRIEPYVFVGEKMGESSIAPLRPYAKIIRTPIVDIKGPWWWLWKIIFLLTGSNCIINRLFRKFDIQVVSHADIVDRKAPYKTINWIPDLQHLHLPEMFSARTLFVRNKKYTALVKKSDAVVVSSKDARNDLNRFVSGYDSKVNVLRFVSQPDKERLESPENSFRQLVKKYLLQEKFFYLPNQFWKHKNHRVVFEAVNILKRREKEISVVCSGYMGDFRNPDHVKSLKNYIQEHSLEKNITLLGLMEYRHVFVLMRYSLAVLNPSLFEGWSSTVEEAKSMGKGMILSGINVHQEQNPPGSEYFTPDDPEQLADILERYWNEKEQGPDSVLEEQAKSSLSERTRDFGRTYQDIILSLC